MGLFPLQCPKCGTEDDYIQGACETDIIVPCSTCGAELTRRDHRVWAGHAPQVNCDHSYFDPSMGIQIKNKQHRQAEMDKRGWEPYAPNPDFKKHRDETLYITKHSKGSEAEANKCIRKENKLASYKRKKQGIRKVFEKAGF